jgi:hypothetical protein
MPFLPSRGRPGVTLLMSVERELTSGDILKLATEPRERIGVPVLKKLRSIHHTAARMLAAGRSIEDTAIATGYTAQRIGDLDRQDPAFQHLKAYYQDQISEANISDAQRVQAKFLDMSERALDLIDGELEKAEDGRISIPVSELRQLATAGADRTVAPPKQATPTSAPPTQITFNIGRQDLRPKELGDNAKDITPKVESVE